MDKTIDKWMLVYKYFGIWYYNNPFVFGAPYIIKSCSGKHFSQSKITQVYSVLNARMIFPVLYFNFLMDR